MPLSVRRRTSPSDPGKNKTGIVLMVDATTIADALRDRILSYLASALPVGNHSSQEHLGQRFFEEWQRDLFKGPYLETIPPYERLQSLSARFGQHVGREQDRLFAERFRPRYSWADTDHKFISARGTRNRIWEPDSKEAAQEMSTTTQQAAWLRPMFKHQWEAFVRSAYGHNSIVVATGTGSGKTECFQLPILYKLLTEPKQIREKRGVRALLIYPLNALVEDQCARLRRLLFWLNLQFQGNGANSGRTQQITFGRYTGDTPLNDRDFRRHEPGESLKGFGELVYRSEMQASPPDILITNFTMLEYMLLREDDKQLFAAPDLFSFIVLDEVHTYSGTQGTEVAMLLRRLKGFLEAKARKTLPIQCIATSATLGGADPKGEGASFASTIFGTQIKPDDVILGSQTRARHSAWNGSRWERLVAMASEDGHLLRALLGPGADEQKEAWARLRNALHLSDKSEGTEVPATERLGAMLTNSGLADQVRSVIESEPDACADLDSIANRIAGNAPRPREAAGVVLSLLASSTYHREPVLALRAHFFINEAKSAHLCINPKCSATFGGSDAWWRQLYVSHHVSCDHCDSPVYPLYLCRRCGFAYLEGWRMKSVLRPEKDDAERPDTYERWLFRPTASDLPTAALELGEARTLCLNCGRHFVGRDSQYFTATQETHECSPDSLLDIWVWRRQDLAGGQMESCLFCDQHWVQGREVITPPAPSAYAVSTLCLEELKRQFVASGSDSKVISFSDTRQGAAQLALRLQETNRDFAFRQMVYQNLREETLTTENLLEQLFRRSRSDMKLRLTMGAEPNKAPDNAALREQLATLLFREAVTAYLTLEAQGLARLEYDQSLLAAASNIAAPSKLLSRLSDEEKVSWFRFLLDWGLRFVRFALAPDRWAGPSISYQGLQEWNIYPKSATIFRGDDQGTVGFLIAKRNRKNAAYNFATRLMEKLSEGKEGLDLEELHAAARPFWDLVLASQEFWAQGLSSADRPILNSGGNSPDRCQLQLNFTSLRWRKARVNEILYQCDRCGRVSFYSIRGVCPIRDCKGSLRPTNPTEIERNRFSPVRHYRKLITTTPVTPLRAEEHTAQISPEKRAQIEKDFRSTGEEGIDVVCGSTTFELGIDLGLIQSVFMSNLPPRAANYRQRAGRAGRRPGAFPFVLNYVRQRPHDQYFWGQPQTFIAGELPVPQVSLSSDEVFRRHVYAILVARLLELHRERHPGQTGLSGPPASSFVEFALAGYTDTRIRTELRSRQLLSDRLGQFLSSVGRKASVQGCWADLRKRLKAFSDHYLPLHADEGCLDVLSDHGILPSYAFPIYVDELRLRECALRRAPRADLRLQRDRSIALREYSPGRTFIAGKYVIRSEGLWHGYDLRDFAFCPNCSAVDLRQRRAPTCTKCGRTTEKKKAAVPDGGFFGQVVNSLSGHTDQGDPDVTDVYFDPAEDDPPPSVSTVGPALTISLVDARRMVRSRMRIFNPRPGHDGLPMSVRKLTDAANPHSPASKCLVRVASGETETLHLMHEFTTDILQVRFTDNPTGRNILGSALLEEELRTSPTHRSWLLDSVWLTIATALRLAGTQQILDIDPQEIGIVLRPNPEPGVLGEREIILYDTSPGGAGYARQLGTRVRELFVAASARLARCPGDCQDSCYACLREYRNQVFHARLHRRRASEGFSAFVEANFNPSRANP